MMWSQFRLVHGSTDSEEGADAKDVFGNRRLHSFDMKADLISTKQKEMREDTYDGIQCR
jgi:hypothetical protein